MVRLHKGYNCIEEQESLSNQPKNNVKEVKKKWTPDEWNKHQKIEGAEKRLIKLENYIKELKGGVPQ